MCGILGAFDLSESGPLDRGAFTAALRLMAHRGPDDEGVVVEPGLALGHRRLAIVDRAGGGQPMADESGEVCVAHNGEIWNHAALRDELAVGGARFRSRSDTEVLLRGYRAWGLDGLLGRLRGMFAFAIWDRARGRLSLARDRMGQKPLYLLEHGGRVFFGSEIRPLLALAGAQARVDFDALALFMRLGFVPAPRTLFAGVRKLPAAHHLVLGRGAPPPRERCYWRLSYAAQPAPPKAEMVERLRARLLDVVGEHLTSDVPLGGLLSGGVDSATVVAAMHRLAPGGFRALTVGFPGAGADYDETDRARACAATLGVAHETVAFTASTLDDLPKLVAALEEPIARGTFAALADVFAAARRAGLPVVLTGEGSDELFGGYSWHGEATPPPPAAWPRALWRRLRGAPVSRQSPTEALVLWYARKVGIGPRRETLPLLAPDVRERAARVPLQDLLGPWRAIVAECGTDEPHKQVLALQSRTRLPDVIGTIVDRMSMASGVEARAPFLDHALWELLAPWPWSAQRGPQGAEPSEKHLLRQAARGWVPEPARVAPKQPLRVPYADWLRRPSWPEWAEHALCPRELADVGLFDGAAVTALRTRLREGPPEREQGQAATQLLAVLTLQTWARTFACAV